MLFARAQISCMQTLIRVEVAYATPERQVVIPLDVIQGCTADEAARQSGLAEQFPDIDYDTIPMGIYGVRIKTATTTILNPGDRLELYRPLIADPKEMRRSRAQSQQRSRS